MFKTMRRGLNRDEGFTLIELMVVVMIIAILIAIAIPSFLGFRKNAQDRAAQSDLRTVLLAQNAYQLENGTFTTDEANILAFEANAPLAPEAEDGVQMFVRDNGNLCLERLSQSGENFGIYVVLNGPTYYGSAAEGAACATSDTPPATFSRVGWGGAPVGGGGGGDGDGGGGDG